MKKLLSFLWLGILLLSVSPAFAEPSELVSLRVESNAAEMHPGDTGQLAVRLLDGDGNPYTGPADIAYTSINPYAVSVDSSGEMTANHVGTAKIIVTAQSGNQTVSRSIALHVTDAASGVLTFENTPNGQLPPGVSTSTPSLTYVTDERGDASQRSALVWDNSTTALPDLKYETSLSQTKTLEFSIYPVGSYAALQLLNGSSSAADTAFWIGFASNGLLYYDGTKYVNITTTNVLTKNKWNKVHIEITNTNGTNGSAAVYVDGALKGTAHKTTGSYGGNTAAGINTVRFMSSGTAPVTDKFYIDNLSFKDGITALEPEPLVIDLGAPYQIADNGADESEYAHIPFTYANPDASRVYVNYSRHEDTYLSHPIDTTKISADGAATFPVAVDNPDMFLMTMAELPDGRTFAKNYMNYYLTDSTAATTSWIIDNDVWHRVDGVLTMPAAEVGEIDGPLVGSNDWYPMVFSKGIVVLEDGTILNTMYGFGKAYLVQSSDNGLTWTYRSTIAANDGTLFHTDGSEVYFAEPSLQLAADGSLLSIMRTVSNMPLYQTRSYDQGLTWTKPELLPGIDPGLATSIYPQTVLLDNGVLVLTTGRPNNKLLFSLDGSGYKWEYAVTTVAPAPPASTTGNTSVSRIGVNKILQVGDNGFVHNAPAGIWGITADITRNLRPNPVTESARLKTEKDIIALQSVYALTLDAVFDTNSAIIDKNDTTIRFYSETPEFAEIDSRTGIIAPKAEGAAKFTASVEHEGVTIISNTVTILIADEQKLYKFETAIDEFALEPGQLATISGKSYSRLGDELNGVSYSYVSSDSSVASVDGAGIVTAAGPGTAVISVTAHKGTEALTKTNSVIVKHPVWQYDSFDRDSVLPPGFAQSNSLGVISQTQAYSGSNALYIKDDSASALAGVTRAFEPAKAAVIEFRLYPERAENSIAIAVGTGSSITANEAVILGFSKPVAGSNTLKVLGYDGLATGIISSSSGVVYNEWSKIRIEVSADRPGKLYVNDQFIVNIPLSAAKDVLDRVRFSSGGTALVGDYYYIDDLKIMYFGDISGMAPSALELAGIPAAMLPNETAQLEATAVYNDGAVIADVTGQAVYSSSNEQVAAVSESGVIAALGEGEAIISAVYGGQERQAPVTVEYAVLPNDPNFNYVGRWDTRNPGEYASYWSGAYFDVGFTGTTVKLKLGGSASVYASIDGGPEKYYPNGNGLIDLTPTALSPGSHTLRVNARSEFDVIRFQGLVLDKGAQAEPPVFRDKTIEFIGDSITAGSPMANWALSDYAWLTGEALKANHTQIAHSGICLVSGVCPSTAKIGMQDQFFKLQTLTFPGSPLWDFTRYQPDIVVINLGTNDHRNGIGDEVFQNEYAAFLGNIRSKYPNAQIYVLRPFLGYKENAALYAVTARKNMGDAGVHYVDTTGWVAADTSDYFPDGLHPTESGHEKIAAKLIAVLSESVPDIEAPAWPDGSRLAVTDATETGVKLSWPAALDHVGVTGYRIYVNGSERATVTGNVYEYSVSGLISNATYDVAVKAFNAAGLESEGLQASAATLPVSQQPDTEAPVWPSGSRLSATDAAQTGIKLLWPAAIDNVGITGYRIYVNGSEKATVAGSVYEYPVAGLTANTTYVFTIKAFDHAGNVSNGLEATAATEAPPSNGGGTDPDPNPNPNPDSASPEDIEPNGPGGGDEEERQETEQAEEQEPPGDFSIAFADTAGHWASDFIKRAVERKIVDGYPDGTFKPDGSVTRAEFIMMIVKGLKLEGAGASLAFTDRDEIGDWVKEAAAKAIQAGIVEGYEDGSLRPNALISRAEMACMIARALKVSADQTASTGFEDDENIPEWAKGSVEAIRKLGIVEGRGGNRFAPAESATRAEALVMVLRSLELRE